MKIAMRTVALLFVLVLALAHCANPNAFKKPKKHCTGECLQGANATRMSRVMKIKEKLWGDCLSSGDCPRHIKSLGATPCVDGKAGASSFSYL
jgi:hypothetical protein